MRILILNGPNINLTGTRQPDVYGKTSLDDINDSIIESAESLGIDVDFFQTNHEGTIVDKLQEADFVYDGVILNAGAFSHYSVAILDAVYAVHIPVIEVHMSNIYAREEFRRTSVISPACRGTITGFGAFSYHLALAAMTEELK